MLRNERLSDHHRSGLVDKKPNRPVPNRRGAYDPEQIKQWVVDAERSCRCDGGGTLCGACCAERHLRALDEGGKAIARQFFTLHGTAFGVVTAFNGRKPLRYKPNPAPRVKWVIHGKYAHVKGYPCAACDGRQ